MMNRTAVIIGVIVLAVLAVGAAVTFQMGTDRSSARSSEKAPSPHENDAMSRFQVGDWQIAIVTNPATPRVGRNALIIELRDEEQNPITGIDLEAYAEMAAMGAMPAMRAPAGLEQTAPGRFEGEVDLRMRGEWPLTVQISDPRGDRRLQFDLATDRAGLTISAGGTPVGEAEAEYDDATLITVDNRRRQLIGLKTGLATHRDLIKTIRAVGRVAFDERLLSEVTLKFDGYIGDLKADYVGAKIEKGQVLFTVYSPELLAAQQEYLEILKRRSDRGSEDPLLVAARQRLALWDMSSGEIAALERRGVPRDYVPIHAPRSGTVIERKIADGSGVQKGQRLLRIADLSRVWIEADVYEADLDLVTVGMNADISLPYLPSRRYTATVEYVYPYLQEASRAGRVRMTLENESGELKPDMYAEVALQVELGHRLSVPEEAIIVAGESRVVFVDLGAGRLRPTRIKTGRRARGFVEVREGLNLGDVVVTSGNVLIAAETRLKTGIEQW
ncbi:MAG: efflux RND transporter periplasmic adaptor subunit [Gammaproteobacteria bacterium]|nr:efflux RND transporter periplasmic adaptor subunit [Gammaproteobacteria bacterium]